MRFPTSPPMPTQRPVSGSTIRTAPPVTPIGMRSVATSAGDPTWAGRIAIADQGRIAAGLPTLSGSTQTLPALYNLDATSPQDFHDITTGGNGTYNAGPGYDEVTGLGSPVANLLVPGLVGDGTAATATELTVAGQPPANVTTGAAFGLTVVAEDASRHHGSQLQRPRDHQPCQQPGGGTLGGTVTENAVDGVATFNNLSINQPGTAIPCKPPPPG